MLFPRQTGALGKVTPRSDENACRRSRNSFSYSQKTVKLRKKYFLPKDINLRARRSHLAGAALSTSPDCSIFVAMAASLQVLNPCTPFCFQTVLHHVSRGRPHIDSLHKRSQKDKSLISHYFHGKFRSKLRLGVIDSRFLTSVLKYATSAIAHKRQV